MSVTIDGTNGYSVMHFGGKQLVRDTNNDLFAVPMETTGANPRMRVWTSSDEGASWTNPSGGNLALTSIVDDTASSIIIDSNDLIHCIFWRNLAPLSNGGLKYCTYNIGTDTWSGIGTAYSSNLGVTTPASFFHTGMCIDTNGLDLQVCWTANSVVRSADNSTVYYGTRNAGTSLWSTRVVVATGSAGGDILIERTNSSHRPIVSVRSVVTSTVTPSATLVLKLGNSNKATSFSTKSFSSVLPVSLPNYFPLVEDNEGRVWVVYDKASSTDLAAFYHTDGDSWSTWSSSITISTENPEHYAATSRGVGTTVRDVDAVLVNSSGTLSTHSSFHEDQGDSFHGPIIPTISSADVVRTRWGNYLNYGGHAVVEWVHTNVSDRLYYEKYSLNQPAGFL